MNTKKARKRWAKVQVGFQREDDLPQVVARNDGPRHPAIEETAMLPVSEQPTEEFRRRPSDVEETAQASWSGWAGAGLDRMAGLMRRNPRRAAKLTITSVVLALLAGYLIGLIIFGWWLWPVEWTGATIANLPQVEQERYVTAVAELFSYDRNEWRARFYLAHWHGDVVACDLAQKAQDFPTRARFESVAFAVNGQGCPPPMTPEE